MFYAINEIGAVANMIHPLSSEKEIEDYFKTASSIVEGKSQTINKPAMASIINGCTTSADVDTEFAPLFYGEDFAESGLLMIWSVTRDAAVWSNICSFSAMVIIGLKVIYL